MSQYLGDFPVGATIYVPFHTFSSDDPSASMTITGLAVTDIEVYKNGSATQRASDAGYTLLDTDGIDFDGTTGLHGFSIDTADNTTADFFTSGADYWVAVASITLDGATINFWAAHFSIENRRVAGELVRTTIATLSSQTSFTLTAGSADDDAYNDGTIIVSDIASGVQKAVGRISDYTGSSKTITLAADPGIFTMAAGDNVSILAPNVASHLVGHTVQTGDSYARLGAPAGASVSADIATVDGNVDEILLDTAEIGAAGAGLTAVPWNSSWDAEVQSEVTDALEADGLDHLVSASVAGSDVADNSIIAKLVSASATADWDDFVNTSDSLQAVRDHIGDGTNLTEAGGDGDHLTEAGGTGDHLTAVPWNSSWDAEVQSEVADALIAIGLDHLISTSVTGTDVADDSIIAKLVSKESTADWDDFVNTTDALQALRDHIGDGTNLSEAGGTGDHLSAVPWNSSWDAEVQSEVSDALIAIGLDHLLSASVSGTDVTDNSILAKLVSASATADWDDFVNTTDSLQAVRDHIGDGTNLTEAGGDGDHLTEAGGDGDHLTAAGSLTTAHSEPTGVPAANETPLDKLGYLFMALRNKVTVTASKKQFFDDGGTAEFEKDLSDDGTTYTETEANAP